MDGLLTTVQTRRIEELSESTESTDFLAPQQNADQESTSKEVLVDKKTPNSILQLLQGQPSDQELYDVLKLLDPLRVGNGKAVLDLRLSHPLHGQILNVLVTRTITEHWHHIAKSNSKSRGALLRCFSSVSGLRSLVGYLQMSNRAIQSSPAKEKESGKLSALRDVLSFTSALLKPTAFTSRIYYDNATIYDTDTKHHVAWSEFVSLTSGGKILSAAAESLILIKDSAPRQTDLWIGERSSFAEWVSKNVSYMLIQGPRGRDEEQDDLYKSAAVMIGRAIGLGHTEKIARELYVGALVNGAVSSSLGQLLRHLRHHELCSILHGILKDIQRQYFSTEEKAVQASDSAVGGVATLLSEILSYTTSSQDFFRSWLSIETINVVTTFGLRRALVLLVAQDPYSLKELLEQALREFGDSFSIKHTLLPIQEANAQVVLLAAGYMHRLCPSDLHAIGRTSLYLNAVSNRLSASSIRARFLGMLVGMAISELVESPDKALKFDLEGFDTEEIGWFLSLTKIDDKLGSVRHLLEMKPERGNESKPAKTSKSKPPLQTNISNSTKGSENSRIVAIEEIMDDESEGEEEDEFIPYAKPDSDASDSDEDPSLIQRVKPSAPVYIRDLISCLKDTENVDRYHLGITNAASLISRKAGFGTELIENIDGLALLIISLQDNYSLPNFHEYRLQAMIALLAAQPIRMGRYFIATFFDADLSQSQRSAVLTAIGLGARKIAGHGEEDAHILGFPSNSNAQTNFPSKELPSHLQQFYDTSNISPVSLLTQKLSRTSLQPLALDAADAASGPDALKVRKFSSRMEVERQRQIREAQKRAKTLSMNLHKDLTEGFFYPLVGRFAIMLQSRSLSSSGYNPFHSANLMRLFLQTVTLIISTIGPNTPALVNITQEVISLIFVLHGNAVSSDPVVLTALLSLFLALIDLNVASGSTAEERLVTEHGTEVLELRDWCNDVFERTPATSGRVESEDGPKDETEQTRMLAAGILVKIGEIVQRYQGRLMGINVGFAY